MTIKAQGQITIVDLSDARQLSAYLTSDMPKTQIFDPNNNSYTPNWNSSNLHITPTIYLSQTPLQLTTSGLSVTWKRKEGAGSETALTSGETVSGNVLTVNQNKLASVSSNMLTYIAYVTYLDPETKQNINARVDITYSLIRHATNVHNVSINGEQVFKYDKDNSLVGATQISLEAIASNVTITKWQYKKKEGTWADYPTTTDNASITSATLIVKPSHPVFFNDVATIKVITNDPNITDIISIAKIHDGIAGGIGTAGKDAIVVLLTNEAQILSANKNGQCKATTMTTNIVAYKGLTKVEPSVTAPSGLPSGMTFNQSVSGQEVVCNFVVSENATLDNKDTGNITLHIDVQGQQVDKVFSWAKSKAGSDGTPGKPGENAVVFNIFAPNGTLVQNGEGTLKLSSVAYDGSTEINSNATYQWSKYVSGSYQNILNGNTKELTIKGSDVANIQTYRCQMTYKTRTYTDVITVEDKTDSLVATIVSTGGTVFKNKMGDTVMTCLLYANGKETDELLSENINASAPVSPKQNDFWYKIDKTAKTVTLQKYNGSTWNVAPEKQKYTYNWYRLDKSGNSVDTEKAFKTGKVIYINSQDVDSKVTFTCEISDTKN